MIEKFKNQDLTLWICERGEEAELWFEFRDRIHTDISKFLVSFAWIILSAALCFPPCLLLKGRIPYRLVVIQRSSCERV